MLLPESWVTHVVGMDRAEVARPGGFEPLTFVFARLRFSRSCLSIFPAQFKTGRGPVATIGV